MLAGVRPEDRSKLRLEGYSYKHFHILSECQFPLEAHDTLVRKYDAWKTCLGALRIPHIDVLRILGAVLLLGCNAILYTVKGPYQYYKSAKFNSSHRIYNLFSMNFHEKARYYQCFLIN